MYSWEIENLLKLRNYLINSKEYLNILNTSPQITHTQYTPATDEFETWTEDKYHFKYKVYRK